MSFIKPRHSKKPTKRYYRKHKFKLNIKILLLVVIIAIVTPQIIRVYDNNFSFNTLPSNDDKTCIEQYDDKYKQNLCKLQISASNIQILKDSNIAKYGRKKFGKPWIDIDNNKCDTRNDILRRDLENIIGDKCKIFTGILQDPYTGKTIKFHRAKNASLVQIDHVVALENAWLNGAWEWGKTKREQFANDPLNLLAVDGASNQIKGSKDFANWVPKNSKVLCSYAKRQISIKSKYNLKVTEEEKIALMKTLEKC